MTSVNTLTCCYGVLSVETGKICAHCICSLATGHKPVYWAWLWEDLSPGVSHVLLAHRWPTTLPTEPPGLLVRMTHSVGWGQSSSESIPCREHRFNTCYHYDSTPTWTVCLSQGVCDGRWKYRRMMCDFFPFPFRKRQPITLHGLTIPLIPSVPLSIYISDMS